MEPAVEMYGRPRVVERHRKRVVGEVIARDEFDRVATVNGEAESLRSARRIERNGGEHRSGDDEADADSKGDAVITHDCAA